MADRDRDEDVNTPHARRIPPHERGDEAGTDREQDDLLDEGIEETFPASDPVSVKRIT